MQQFILTMEKVIKCDFKLGSVDLDKKKGIPKRVNQ
jgi:hypothetical protein